MAMHAKSGGDLEVMGMLAGRASGDAFVVLDAFALPENAGKGVIQLNGKMVERLHAEMAARTLAIADGIAARAALDV